MSKTEESYRFPGFDPPYYTPVPDAVFDELLPRLAGNEVKVLLYIIRRTFGFKKQADAISLSQITDGIVRHDGTRLDGGAGVSKAGAITAIRGLVEKGVILAERQQAPDGGHAPTVYRLHMRESAPLSKNLTRGRGSLSKKQTRGGLMTDQALDQNPDPQETVVQETENKKEDHQETLSEDETPPAPPPPYSPVIAGAVLELARDLRDDLAGPGAVQAALRLWQHSGLDEAAFVARLQAARSKQRRLSGVLGVVARQMEEPQAGSN